jgi:hypothetical protein
MVTLRQKYWYKNDSSLIVTKWVVKMLGKFGNGQIDSITIIFVRNNGCGLKGTWLINKEDIGSPTTDET